METKPKSAAKCSAPELHPLQNQNLIQDTELKLVATNQKEADEQQQGTLHSRQSSTLSLTYIPCLHCLGERGGALASAGSECHPLHKQSLLKNHSFFSFPEHFPSSSLLELRFFLGLHKAVATLPEPSNPNDLTKVISLALPQ